MRALLWIGLALPLAAQQSSFPDVTPTSAIRFVLERKPCFGSCPVYRIEISGDGEVLYTGERYVAIPGPHSDHVPAEAVQGLIERFRKADFFELEPEYRSEISDLATNVVSLMIDGRRQTVTEYGGPQAVAELERAVDRAAGDEKWVRGNAQTVPFLKAEGWDFQTPENGIAVVRVASIGSVDALRDLIAAGAPVNAEDEQHRTALAAAALRANHEALALLIQAGASANDARAKASAVVNAAGVGDAEGVRMLLAYGADPNLQRPFTALIAAASSGSPDVVEEILKHKPDLNARDAMGRTAIRVVGEAGLTSSMQDLARVTEMLVAAGADVNIADNAGNTPLHGAGDERSAKAMIAGGANVNARNRMGETPLMTTVDEAVTRVLLDAGADATLKNVSGRTAFDYALRDELTEKAAILEAAAAKKK